MGKKGGWFSAIKRVFSHNSKEKPSDGSDKKSSKEKKKGKGILRHGENKSLIPLFREPSSIEKILGEADQLLIRPPTFSEQPQTQIASPNNAVSNRASSPKIASSARLTSPRANSSKTVSSKVTQSHKEISYVQRAEPNPRNEQLSAIKIQAAYRGYMARRNFRGLRGLVRLQGVMRGQNVKRQTMSAMKQMQLLVRVQTQIQSRRIQMLENQALHRNNDKEVESKWTLNQLSEAGHNDDWDDSLLTKEEVEARLRKKVEAVVKRERAMAYAYSHQLWKANPRSAESPVDIRSNGFPWWWNWLERQLPPARPISEYKMSPQLNASNFTPDNLVRGAGTPQSSRSAILVRAKQFQTTPSTKINYSKPRASAAPANSSYDLPLRDDDSLTSCPPFSVPNYMTPTVSTIAKVRANSNPKERLLETPGNDSTRRFSFPLTPNIGSFKWNKGSNKDSASQKASICDLSVDSTVSMPAMVGRKPFNRFV